MLLTTKLFMPRRLPQLVARPRLLAKLQAGIASKLLLVCAPAGFGKTTLITEWIAAQHEQSFSWFSLDENDNDPIRFVTYLVAALQRVDAGLGRSVQALLTSAQPPDLTTMMTILLNEISQSGHSFVLVLDDFHLISAGAIHEAITFLVEQMPPPMHLVITSRVDPPLPLARWRVRRLMTEIRQRDLCFDREEAALFLHETMAIPLSPEDVRLLDERTEGWIAGLQLAALSLQNQADSSGFIQRFRGNNTYIVDYLMEEVWQHQPEAVQTFLLQTAILERLTAALCDAVTGRKDGQAMLDSLQRANLFLIPLDDERKWYRYHHLFADMLHNRQLHQADDNIRQRHERASRWYADALLLDDAIDHAILATNDELAADVIEGHAMPLLLIGEVTIVGRWLDRLPVQLMQSRPRLALVAAWRLLLIRQLDTLETLLTTAPALQSTHFPPVLQNQLGAIQASCALWQGDFALAQAHADQTLPLVTPENEFLRATLYHVLGVALAESYFSTIALSTTIRPNNLLATMHGSENHLPPIRMTEEAKRWLRQAIDLGVATGNYYYALMSSYHLAVIELSRGHLRYARQTLEQAIRWAEANTHVKIPMVAVLQLFLADILIECDDEVERAIALIDQGISVAQHLSAVTALWGGWTALARYQQFKGHPDQALQILASGLAWLKQAKIDDFLAADVVAGLAAYHTQLLIWQGKLDQAADWAQTVQPRHKVEQLAMARYHLALYRQQRENREAELAYAMLLPHLQQLAATGKDISSVEALVLYALLAQAQGNDTTAFKTLDDALSLAIEDGYVRIFVDEGEPMRQLLYGLRSTVADAHLHKYIDQLLITFPTAVNEMPAVHSEFATSQKQPAQNPKLIEPLSEREREVLRLVAAGLSNQQIADKLIITVGTAKRHLNNIFGKLQVASRTQAIVRARELDLL